ncbi:MAG: PHP domain-containing protein [Chloroflexi bacterium]|nr:PHP domain-containing protein [Chloroflexota bacterium]
MSPHVILKAAGARGVNCLAITDHNSIKGSLELQRIAPIRIILAEEIKTLQGEIIGLFLQEEIPRRLSAEETVSKIKEQGGLVYVPHPFDRLRGSRLRRQTLLEIVGQVDIMEVFNSRVTFPRDNALAREFADRFGLAHGGGSDAHVAYEIGRTVVEIPDFETPAEFLIALRQGAVRGRLSPPLVHLASTFRKFRRRYLPRR